MEGKLERRELATPQNVKHQTAVRLGFKGPALALAILGVASRRFLLADERFYCCGAFPVPAVNTRDGGTPNFLIWANSDALSRE